MLDLKSHLAASAAPQPQLAALDARLRDTLEQLRTSSLRRAWLRALLYEPAGAAAAGGGAATTAAGGAAGDAATGGAAAVTAAAGGVAAAGAAAADGAERGGTLRSLEGFAEALLATQRHVSTHALSPAQLRARGGGLGGDAAVRGAVQAYLRG